MSETAVKYTKEQIVEKLKTDNKWLWRGILAIYKHQTDAEQAAGVTREDNGIGFNAIDSAILSSFAQQIIKWQASWLQQQKWPCPLTLRQLPIARTKMVKYAGQLVKIANGEQQ